METAATDLLLGSKLDKYRVEQRIGSGGMGIVYRGVHSWTERPVAIKVLHAILQPGAADARRLLREARAAAALRHPNVVDVLDMGQDDSGRVYLVMELLCGRSLRALLKDTPCLSLSETLGYLRPIMDALARAHELGIIHRDLKPDNVFLAEEHGSIVPKLLDFGVVKLLDCTASGPTESGALLGTPRYMSPEQINGEPTGTAADMWGMGLLLFECLAGRLPFESAPTLPALWMKVTSVDAASLSTYRPDLPAHVAAAIARALQRAPEARFSSIRELAAALTTDASRSVAAVSGDASHRPPRNAAGRRVPWRAAIGLTLAAPLAWAFASEFRSSGRDSEPGAMHDPVQSQANAAALPPAEAARPPAEKAQPLATLPPAPRDAVRVTDAAFVEITPPSRVESPPAAGAPPVRPSPAVSRAKTKRASAKTPAPPAAAAPATTPAHPEPSALARPQDDEAAEAPPDIISDYEQE